MPHHPDPEHAERLAERFAAEVRVQQEATTAFVHQLAGGVPPELAGKHYRRSLEQLVRDCGADAVVRLPAHATP